MDINASIIDQRLTGLLDKHADLFAERFKKDEDKKRSAAFVTLCMENMLGVSFEAAFDLLTEGGDDAGVDGLHIDNIEDGEITVTLFQGKYKIKDLSGEAHFPENGVEKALNTVQILFDPSKEVALNPYIKPKIEEIRSFIRDGYIPNINMILCNNGQKWNENAQKRIDQACLPEDQVKISHFNHDAVVSLLKNAKAVNDTLVLAGEATVESFNFKRVMVGKTRVTEIARLFKEHGDALLERNIRRYLGLRENRVNNAIHNTLSDPNNRENFYFFNNGITIICKNFKHNALQKENFQVRMEEMQIINGGQTGKTIFQTLKNSDLSEENYENTFVPVRIYELLGREDEKFITDITYATNSQNPVELRDLRSNDDVQKRLEIAIKDLGYIYKRQRDDTSVGAGTLTSGVVAEAVLAIWRQKPHQAKLRHKQFFDKLYSEIFTDLNAAQAVLAVLIFRSVEAERKKAGEKSYEFIPYASHYIAMLIGNFLLQKDRLKPNDVTHRNFQTLQEELTGNFESLYARACRNISSALVGIYNDKKELSLQQIAAAFRRGDVLVELLEMIDELLEGIEGKSA